MILRCEIALNVLKAEMGFKIRKNDVPLHFREPTGYLMPSLYLATNAS